MAEAPLSLLLGGGSPRLVAEDRPLLAGVRLRRLRLRPTFSGPLAELITGGPGRVRRLLERPVDLERCELELRVEAMEEQLRQALRGTTFVGSKVERLELELDPQGQALLLHLVLIDGDGVRVDWGAQVALYPRGARLWLSPRVLWACPSGGDPRLYWGVLLARFSRGRGLAISGESLVVEPLALWLDRWLVLGGHRPLRLQGAPGLELQSRSHGLLELLIGERVEASSEAGDPPPLELLTDAASRLGAALSAGEGERLYRQLAEIGGAALPESAAWELAGTAQELEQSCAALELAAAHGSPRAGFRLAMTRGRGGDRSGVIELLERAWRVAARPVVQARVRIAWALATAHEAKGLGAARREIEGLVAELGDGGWPSTITGEAWAAAAKLRVADPEVRGELVLAAAFEASHHMSAARGGETLLEVAVDLYERGDVDVGFARRARAAGEALVLHPDPELVDRLRNWGELSPATTA